VKNNILCSKCDGEGFFHNNICEKCHGEGTLDWIENVVGKSYPISYNDINNLNIKSTVSFIDRNLNKIIEPFIGHFMDSVTISKIINLIDSFLSRISQRFIITDFIIDNDPPYSNKINIKFKIFKTHEAISIILTL